MDYKTTINSIVAFLGTGVAYLLGGWDTPLGLLALLMVLDYVTGIMKGIKDKNLASDIGYNGLLKKAGIFIVVILAHQMDKLTGQAPVFRTAACIFYSSNEGLSITENIALLGVPLPPGLIETLKKLKNTDNNTDLEKGA